MNKVKLTGLVAAAHTPFAGDGSLNLEMVEKQAQFLVRQGVSGVFIAGSTGEHHSLTFPERQELAQRWADAARGTNLTLVVHVGSNCLSDAQALASQAARLGMVAISAVPPSYDKPRTLGSLVGWCAAIASAAPETHFYYYDVPTVTGVQFSMPDFLDQAADRIPTLAGIKFANPDLLSYQLCLRLDDGAFDIPWGVDEALLAAIAVGAQGAIGTTYNFVAPLYRRMLLDFRAGKHEAAREAQFRAVQLIQLLARYGILPATKAVMQMLGVDVGPARLPHTNSTTDQIAQLRSELEQLGLFDWIAATKPQPK